MWQFRGNKNQITPGEKSAYPYKKARLADTGDDLTKRWFVVYYAWSEAKEKLVRKRVEVKGDTLEARLKEAKDIIKEVNKLLKAGMVTDVLSDEPAEPEPEKYESIQGLLRATIYFLDVKKTSLKANSHKTYRSSVKLFQTYLKDHNLGMIRLDRFTAVQAFGYMDYVSTKLRLSNKSYNKHLGVLETLFNFYLYRQQIRINPFVGIKPLPERPGKHTAFSPDQISRIKGACELIGDHQLWLFLNFLHYTLARPQSELRLLRVGDILEKTIRIDSENAKNNRTMHVLIPPPLERLIQHHRLRDYPASHYVFTIEGIPGEKPAYEKYFYNQHRRILTLLKLTDKAYDLYGWKHTGVIALYKATKDVKLIQRQCRHSSLDQTDKYLRDLGLFLDEDQLSGVPSL
ncbi:site-specific integrase [Spirosoma sp. RP8]|uniref:Site-specific integrase n=1 Tax=Spirosoma liriopis TaxID=2937440 RepID=A0ABT0HUK6_9BACT|nr:site-specific integrase [Spirosoma liriopis]MCK8495903.1 site-specific integrase [Spirosoma liriopis]